MRDAPTLPDVWPRLVEVLTEPDTGMLAAFNANFDLRIIRNVAARAGLLVPALTGLCLMKLATAYYDRDYFLSLDEAGALAGIARASDDQSHRALGDARYTAWSIRSVRTLTDGREKESKR